LDWSPEILSLATSTAKSFKLVSKELSLFEKVSKNSFATSWFSNEEAVLASFGRFLIPSISVISRPL